ncbi:hypothetical protein FSC37_03185 [Piscinibacter aquaticus]|uniref:Uncharacterized protein n=1 Tax=Piscinibacter aquaticus TaxID=392597 RepID=A0A5C6U0V5_9BURK|nr:hypothetical protein FSC37_03185 [Piscinibacter aquaticus]
MTRRRGRTRLEPVALRRLFDQARDRSPFAVKSAMLSGLTGSDSEIVTPPHCSYRRLATSLDMSMRTGGTGSAPPPPHPATARLRPSAGPNQSTRAARDPMPRTAAARAEQNDATEEEMGKGNIETMMPPCGTAEPVKKYQKAKQMTKCSNIGFRI